MLIAWIIFSVVIAASLLGMALHCKLPERYQPEGSREAIRLVMGLITTMVALVVGLLIAAARSSYDGQRGELVNLAAQVVQLDRVLSFYGSEALPAREEFRVTIARFIDQIWPAEGDRREALERTRGVVAVPDFYTRILNLEPQSNAQRSLQARALEIGAEIGRRQVLMFAQAGSAIPIPFLVVLVFWLVILFVAFGLLAPVNRTAFIAFLFGALSVASAISLILQLDRPYEGLMQLSSAPLRGALAEISR